MSVNSGIVDEPDACGTGRDARRQIASRDAVGGAAQIEARPRRPCFGRGARRAARGLEQERRQQSPARDHSADGSICCVGRSAPVVRLAAFVLAVSAIAACGGKAIHLGDGRDGAPTACTAAHVNANEVLWIGDSWILVTGDEHTRVRDLARVAGAIGPNDDYVIGAMAAAGMAAIANQYAAREAGATKVKVVIMDGGTWDTIQGGAANDVATTFTSFLSRVAADGTVQHIVYFLPPEIPSIPGVAALRPLLMQACAASTVPCHFLDLQTLWSVHPEYTDANLGFLPTVDGSRAVGDAIWTVMQQSCIAQ